MPTIEIGVSANATSDGQVVDFDFDNVSSCSITNNSSTSIQFSTGSAWASVTSGSTVSVGRFNGADFRIRHIESDSYPRSVSLEFEGSNGLTSANVQAVQRGVWCPTAVVFGDSFSARVNSSLVDYRQSDHGYWTWANLLLGSPMRLIGNFGVAGNRTDEMLARIAAVESAGAEWVFVQGGINDLAASVPASTVVANLVSICERLRKGSKVVLLNLAPNPSYTSGVLTVNAALANYAQTAGNLILVDVFSAVVNPTDTTGAFAANMSNDNLHLTVAGARAYGAAIAAAISEFMPAVPFLPASAADSVAINAGCSQIITNPLMSGSSGTVSGTGASGTVATSWSAGTDTGTVTSVWLHGQSRSDGIGVDQQVTCSGAAANAIVNLRQTSGLTARVAAGDTIFACGSISLSGMADVARVQPSVSVTVDGVSSVLHCLDNSDTTWPQTDVSFNWRTTDFLLTAVPTVLQMFIRIRFGSSGAGACVAKFGRTGIYKR